MDRKISLIFLVALAGCTTTQDRLSNAKAVEAIAKQMQPQPVLPVSCTALMERVKPKPDEPWVISDYRWNVIADNRDKLAIDCQEEWSAYWTAYKSSLSISN